LGSTGRASVALPVLANVCAKIELTHLSLDRHRAVGWYKVTTLKHQVAGRRIRRRFSSAHCFVGEVCSSATARIAHVASVFARESSIKRDSSFWMERRLTSQRVAPPTEIVERTLSADVNEFLRYADGHLLRISVGFDSGARRVEVWTSFPRIRNGLATC